jgi:ABC-type glycerol-3-phosphate transport system substrate-binding protein
MLAVAASALTLAGCGGDSSTEADTATETVATTPQTTTTETQATEPTATTAAPQAKVITIRVVKGVPQGGIQRPTIDQGDKVVLVVRTDSGEAVHLHGYDIEKDVVPGKPVRLPFTADIAGRFEVELHPTDTLLAVLEVKP